jgi:DNA-binding transcriptional LysR family regulator
MDRLHAMRVFARVIDAGSFAGAARALNLSPAAITRLVAELERHLGTRLVNRTTRRLALTEAGEAYLAHVRRILKDIEAAEAQAGLASSVVRGELKLLVPPAIAVHHLAPHLPAFHAQHPHVTVQLDAPGPVNTVDPQYDVTILTSVEPLSGDFIARPLAHSEVILCASPAYLDRRGRPAHPSALAEHAAMVPPFLRELVFTPRDGQGAPVTLASTEAALRTTHTDTMYAAAVAGLGIAGLPSFLAGAALVERRLEQVLPDWRLFSTTIYAGMPTREHLPRRTRAFVDFLVETFGGEAGRVDPWLRAADRTEAPGATVSTPTRT